MGLASGQAARTQAARQRLKEHKLSGRMGPTGGGSSISSEGRPSLEERLLVYTAADADPVPPQLMRKYIAYARTYVHPSLSAAAKEVRACATSTVSLLQKMQLFLDACGR